MSTLPKNKANFFKVYNTLRRMSSEQKRLLSSKKLQGKKPASRWLLDIKQLVDYDRMNDDNRKRFILWPVLSFGLAILSFFVNVYIALPLVVIGILFIIGMVKISKSDLNNTMRDTLVPLLTILEEETNTTQLIALDLYLGKKEKKAFITEIVPKTGGIKTTFYEIPYFQLNTKLTDGSMVEITFLDKIRRRDIVKRSASGKTKFKTKKKLKATYILKIAFPNTVYQFSPNESVSDAKVKTKSNEKRNVINIKRSFVFNDLDYSPKIETILGMVAEGYKEVKKTA